VEAYEGLSDLLGRIASYAMLYYVGDTDDPERSKFFGDTQGRLTDISLQLLFFELEFNRIDDAVMERALAAPRLAHYRPWVADLRKERPHQLDDRIEELFHEKSLTGAAAWNRLFDETMSALRFTVEGETLSLEPTLKLMLDHDGTKRQAAAEALSATLGANLRLFTHITNTLAKDKEISDRWHRFEDVTDSRHLANRVERPVVEALVSSVQSAYPRLSHRYYAIKARWLGKDKLAHWDRNAPLPEEDDRQVPWDEARALVLDAYGGFSPEMARIAKRFFDGRWIDAPVRPGKTPGAFSHSTVPSAHPYVLLNYQGKTRDVMTLAHELGHGVHQVLAAEQGALMASTPLTLAETASVFGEMLTFQALLAQTTDPVKRKVLLASKVEDMLNTVVRQIAFFSFERNRASGAPERRADRPAPRRNLARSVTGKPRARDRPQARLRGLLGLYPALHPLALLRLRLCLRRLPGELALRPLPGKRGRLHRTLFRPAEGRRLQAPLGAPEALRPRRVGPRLLGHGAERDRRPDHRAGRPRKA
jgi:oligoendopeptidase F